MNLIFYKSALQCQYLNWFSVAILLFATACGTKSENNRPNVVFIFTDDHAAHAISAYGGIYKDIAPTPNIDRLADEGAMMTNVMCTNAICGPSRASILTGKYSHKNGYYKNRKGGYFNGDQWTFPKEFQHAGYQTALVGKWHLASVPQGFDYYKYHIAHGEQGLYWNPVYNDNGSEIKEEGYATNLTTDFALNWLSKREQDKPFCLMLQYKAPHREWSPDTKYENLWDDMELPYPATFNDDYQSREQTAGDTWMTMDYFNRRDMKLVPPNTLTASEQKKWLNYGNKPNEIVSPTPELEGEALRKWKYQTYIKDYLACVKSVDDNIGRVLKYLKANGLEENTIVVYSSDQGFYLGDHGWFDKRFMYEQSLKMPFLVRYPGKIKPGTINKDIVTNVDFAPTLLDMVGLSAPEEVQGNSFFYNLMDNTPANWRQSMYYHYYEYPQWHHVQPHYGIRNTRFKLIHFYYDMDVWEFYDLEKDPNELKNSIDDPTYADIIEDLKIELKSLMAHYGNDKSLDEFRTITDTDFGGLESGKKNGAPH